MKFNNFRTMFMYTPGKFYLGINCLLVDFLNIRSSSELGLHDTFTFSLYEQDQKIMVLVRLYDSVYR